MSTFLQALYEGVINGTIYALIAMALLWCGALWEFSAFLRVNF